MQPTLVITTGTAGGIGKEFEVGDVVVSPIVRFDCLSKFKKQPFAQEHFSSRSAVTTSSASTPRTTTSISRGSATSPTRRSRPRHLEAAGAGRRPDLQGFWSMEHGL
ncbi:MULTISPECIES: hypothetical protein [unclassified Bradyrhizobium]